jgi:hypothetical protein
MNGFAKVPARLNRIHVHKHSAAVEACNQVI